MRYFLIHPENPGKWKIETKEPQAQPIAQKDRSNTRMEPQIKEVPPPPYKEISEDELIELALEVEQHVAGKGLELAEGLYIDILDDLGIVFIHFETVYDLAKEAHSLSLELDIGTLHIEHVLNYDPSFEFVRMGREKVILTLYSNNRHAINFLSAVAAHFPLEVTVERIIKSED